MRIAPYRTLLLLAAVAMLVPTLSGCDATGDQKLEWNSGDSLSITGPRSASNEVIPYDGYAPGTAFFLVEGFNANQTYAWSVSPDLPSEVRRYQELFMIQYDAPGTYTVTVSTTIDGQEYSGQSTVTITAPTLLKQIQRLPQFGIVESVVGLTELGATLGSDTTETAELTLLVPTQDALLAKFDANGDGSLESGEIPAPAVLADLLGLHILTEKVTPDEIKSGLTVPSVEGGSVTFQSAGDSTATVVVKNGMGNVVSQAEVTATGLPISNGILYTASKVLIPASASVDIADQTAATSVVVSGVYLPEGGFIAIHDSTLLGKDNKPFTADDDALGSVIGVSEKLGAGFHSEVKVALFGGVPGATFTQDALKGATPLIAMPHKNDGDGRYEFVASGGAVDGPYIDEQPDVNGGQPHAIVDVAAISVEE